MYTIASGYVNNHVYTIASGYVNNHVHNDMSTIMNTMDSGYVNNHVQDTLMIGHLLCTLHVKDIVPYTNNRIGEGYVQLLVTTKMSGKHDQ